MTPENLTVFIKQEAQSLGFIACGIATANPVPTPESARLYGWLQAGRHGEMGFMERHQALRLDPQVLAPGARSLIVVAFNYANAGQRPASGIARYACRPDYHPLIRARLRELMERIKAAGHPVNGRAFSDSAPLLERYWAWQAGIGWMGKNRMLITPGIGSWYLLGVLVTDLELQPDSPQVNRCGQCHRCLDACPGQALHETEGLDARRCIAYLTIEKRTPFNEEEQALCHQGGWLFGCDICQEVCPWNRFSQPADDPDFPTLPHLEHLDPRVFQTMTPDVFSDLTAGTALERTGLTALRRNSRALDVQTGTPRT